MKRATQAILSGSFRQEISIHALVKRATEHTTSNNTVNKISIHALVKRATYCYTDDFLLWIISIHALVKRATSHTAGLTTLSRYFNPRPREEGDFRHRCFLPCDMLHFNPRPREEGDFFINGDENGMVISIHALVKRATEVLCKTSAKLNISIHALVKRATARSLDNFS